MDRKQPPIVIKIDDAFTWERCAASTETHKVWNHYCLWKRDNNYT